MTFGGGQLRCLFPRRDFFVEAVPCLSEAVCVEAVQDAIGFSQAFFFLTVTVRTGGFIIGVDFEGFERSSSCRKSAFFCRTLVSKRDTLHVPGFSTLTNDRISITLSTLRSYRGSSPCTTLPRAKPTRVMKYLVRPGSFCVHAQLREMRTWQGFRTIPVWYGQSANRVTCACRGNLPPPSRRYPSPVYQTLSGFVGRIYVYCLPRPSSELCLLLPTASFLWSGFFFFALSHA